MFRFEDVSFEYTGEDKEVLRHINLTIPKGQWMAVIGANGCGKSTFARHLNGLLLPTEGDVWVNGLNTKSETDIWEIRRQVAFVMQNPDNQIVASTVEEDVAFGPENLGIPSTEIRQRVHDALEWVGLAGYEQRPSYNLSGGQKQRLAIAGALAMNTSALILDEPTSMLDPQGCRELMETIDRLHREKNLTIVQITHHMSEAIWAERVISIQQGTIAMDDTPEHIFTNVDALKQLGVYPPMVTRLANKLAQSGFSACAGALTVEDLVERICQLYYKM